MTEKRLVKIKHEAIRRLNLWFIYSDFDEMCLGSRLKFEMQLGLFGYPFAKEEWMKNQNYNKFITLNESNSNDYNDFINKLFDKAYEASLKSKEINNELFTILGNYFNNQNQIK